MCNLLPPCAYVRLRGPITPAVKGKPTLRIFLRGKTFTIRRSISSSFARQGGRVKVCQTFLFLCTGNFYRSRHAEAWFNYKACEHGLHWWAESRGFRPHLSSEDLSHWAADRLDRSGIARSLTPTKPAKFTTEYLANSTFVIAMREAEHASMRRRDFPKWTNRIRYWDISETDKIAPETELPKIGSEVDNLVRNLRSRNEYGRKYDALTDF